MARTSKRKIRLESKAEKLNCPEPKYNVGIYARLSVDNHDEKEVSIENQIELAKKYLSHHPEMRIYDCYSDLGATGTNFARAGFERLMQDIRDEYVNCVIVKDFSRFGRNYIETGNYIEKVFPFMGVRFIAITDQFDSNQQPAQNEALSMHLKNIANELYARDISEKSAATKRAKMQNGDYIGSIAPYGYVVNNKEGKRVLFPEPESAEIVKKIYELFDGGKTLVAIVNWLYKHKVHRPCDYRKYGTVYWREGQKLTQWGTASVKVVLTNLSYLGHLTQRNKELNHPITVENTHQPLIQEEVYYRAWDRLENNIRMQKREVSEHEMEKDIFYGLIYCGECGRHLYSKTAKKYPFYGCAYMNRIDSEKCDTQYISSQTIRNIIVTTLNIEFAVNDVKMKKMTALNMKKAQDRKVEIQDRKIYAQETIEQLWQEVSSSYLEYRSGKITREAFMEKKEEIDERKKKEEELCFELDKELKMIDQKAEKQNLFLRSVVKFKKDMELTSELVHVLIREIRVYSGKRVEIFWNFSLIKQGPQFNAEDS